MVVVRGILSGLAGVLLLTLADFAAAVSISDYASQPPTLLDASDPNVMLDLSIESPMVGAAYNDQPDTRAAPYTCGGRVNDGGTVGVCYTHAREFIGYFDPNKCYTYDVANTRFAPAAVATNHACVGQWSGNFLNWATMTAIDEFRWALTGGNRISDTTTLTVLRRANMTLAKGHSWYPVKMLKNPTLGGAGTNVAPSSVTPFNDNKLYIYNHGYQLDVGTTYANPNDRAVNLEVRPKVCDSGVSLESNCNAYGSNHKPEGLIQENAGRMRFSLMSYALDGAASRDGGVLRANMKYVGPIRPATTGGTETNPFAEFDTNGLFVNDPDGIADDAPGDGVDNSGIINYVNKFGANGYKSYDPASELYYECIRYFKHLAPTPEYAAGLTNAAKDGFPVITSWADPIQNACQKNFIVGINDANPWLDKQLPGTFITCNKYRNCGTGTALATDATDFGNPGSADATINVRTLTNTVGALQGINGTSQCIGCTAANCDKAANNKNIPGLGEVFGTCPDPVKENSYYIAGLSYYAHTNDLRSDFEGDQTIATFMIDTQEYKTSPLLGQMNMLWLAGKYGGFKESDNLDSNSDGNDQEPNLVTEWDADGDGTPDNYVLATDPDKLVEGLARAFSDIQERISSATSASVIANSYTGAGALFQALYSPRQDVDEQQVRWVGRLHALFIDDKSNLREDGDGDGALDDCLTDPIVEIYYDQTEKVAQLRRYATPADCDLSSATFTELSLDQLRTVWSARERLAQYANNQVTAQRSYSDPASLGRHILTSLNGTTLADFTAATFAAPADFGYLRAANDTEATNIVNYIRGDDSISGYRTRTIDYDGDGTDEVWRLGDIVHSNPVAVAAPGGSYGKKYDEVYGDDSYERFRTTYASRRQVVYVGANDGMIHAFNGGFWDESNQRFQTSVTGKTAHALGEEIWAYVPFNLLPHVEWLTGNDYTHVAFMDGAPLVMDARVFADDTTHPGGWGTLLVMGMRLGGGPVDLNNDGTPETRSSYVILDITNPEIPPSLVAEVNHGDLGFTTSEPALVVRREASSGKNWSHPAVNEWYLVFGSGPDTLSSATSTRNAKLYVYDLVGKEFVTNFAPYDLGGILAVGDPTDGIATSFLGSPASVDWGPDYKDDVVYFGSDGMDGVNQAGRLFRLRLDDDRANWSVSMMMDLDRPMTTRPLLTRDIEGSRWVQGGTGRMWVTDDKRIIADQIFFGLKEPKDITTGSFSWGALTLADLQNVTDVQVFTDGTIGDPGDVVADTTTTFSQLKDLIGTKSGWYFSFDHDDINPSTRNVTSAIRLGEILAFTDYTPPADLCEAEGESRLWVLHFMTGTAYYYAAEGTGTGPLGTDDSVTNPSGAVLVVGDVSLGQGMASSPVAHQGTGGDAGSATIITQSSTGAISTTDVTLPTPASNRLSWREIWNF